MKKYLSNIGLFFLLLLPSTFVFAATEIYKIDPLHSYVLWHINHFGFSNPAGKWFAQGTLELDQAKPENSKVNVVIQIAEMSTGIPELDKHMKTPLFFDVEKYPTATFVSDKVTLTGKDTADVHGMLTIRGVTKPIVLNVKLNKIGVNPITEKQTAGFSATTALKRSDFGMNTLVPNLGDDVKLEIEVEAKKL